MTIVLQFCVFLMMAAVGVGLKPDDFRRLGKHPRLVIVAAASQWLILPMAAWAITWTLPLPSHLVAGMVVLAACPAGAVSNYFSYLARADVALSVSLTAISLVASIVTMPIIATAGVRLLLAESSHIVVPVTAIASQLMMAVLLPVLVGMALRHRFPASVLRHEGMIRRASNIVLLLTVGVLIVGLGESVLENLGITIVASVVLIIAAAGIGATIGQMTGADRPQRQTLIFEFACRNTAITMLVGMATFHRPEIAAFGLVVFLTQMPMMLGWIAVARLLRPVQPMQPKKPTVRRSRP